MEPIHIDRPIIVEGKYDKAKLRTIMSGTVITTEGFGIFTRTEKLALIRRLAGERGIILLTDSDGAGGVIRSYITSAVPKGSVTQIYIPKIKGKERRKRTPSKEGTLGVEGIDAGRLRELLMPFSREGGDLGLGRPDGEDVTKADLYAYGMSGADGATEKRDRFAEASGLPAGMTPNAFLAAINVLYNKETYRKLADELFVSVGVNDEA